MCTKNLCIYKFATKLGLAAVLTLPLMAQAPAAQPDDTRTNKGNTPASAQPDNTRANKGTTPTADQQKETATDREMAQKIRKSLTSDKSLSTYAHNVKVIVQNGTVTLQGPVRSDDEKAAVEAKAKEVAGSSSVQNELTVAPKNNSGQKQ
jgi:osmotically-inducible protein OsmY